MNNDTLFVRHNGHHQRVLLKEISHIEALRNYCYLCLQNGSKFLLSMTLLNAGRSIPYGNFERISRSCIINLELVDAFFEDILYIGEKSFHVSRSYRKNIFEKFSILDTQFEQIN